MKKPKALLGLFGVLTIMASMTLSALPSGHVFAQQITARSLTLQPGSGAVPGAGDSNGDGILDGGSTPHAQVDHYFQFTLPTAYASATSNQLGSIKFEYCTTAADVGSATCQAPSNMDATTTSGIDESGSDVTGWSLGTTTANSVVITHTATDASANTKLKIQVQNVTNPDGGDCTNQTDSANCTFFVRISSYTSLDASGTAIDTGTVAAAVSNQVKLKGTMPESLVFCAGDKIPLTSGVPDCTLSTNAVVNFNQLFSPTSTAFATSQIAASTNAGTGYVITVNGPTLTSGSNTVKPINQANDTYDGSAASPWSEPSRLGISQFGLNVVLNDANADYSVANPTQDPPVISGNGTEPDSANINPASGTGNFNGKAYAGYDTDGFFKYNPGDIIANSSYTGSNIYSDSQIYTVSYIANVPGSLAAGDYQTTLTYICTPTF